MSDYVHDEIYKRIEKHGDYEVAMFEYALGNRQTYIELFIAIMVEFYKETVVEGNIINSRDIKEEYEYLKTYVNADWEKYDNKMAQIENGKP